MHKISLAGLIMLFILILVGVSACSILGGEVGEATSTPLPTSIINKMQVVSPQACLVAEQRMIRAENPQGDLVSWSPVANVVAYIASTQGSTWNVGELNLLSAPSFDNPKLLAKHVAGELSWSPDGLAIAFLGLRQSDNLYTIELAWPTTRTSRDLFPDTIARTDDWSSQKAILEWMDTSRLRVLVSCGLDCMQTQDIALGSGLISPLGNPLQRDPNMWAARAFHPSIIPPEFAGLPGQLNWSWDEQHIAYIDENDYAWVINIADGSLYPLEISQYGTVTETDWSFDNQYLAVQVDQFLKIFSFNCP